VVEPCGLVDALLAYEHEDDVVDGVASQPRCKHSHEPLALNFCEVLRKWLVAMLASWLGSNTVNHVILVLIGEQGVYKTTWFNYLLPPELRRYFYNKVNINRTTRDEMIYLSRYALMCYEELDCMNSADLNRLKGIVTMEHIDEREPYARYAEHRPHIAS
ncbi:VapE domain-containing protein, partial [Parabacteroides distasonis]